MTRALALKDELLATVRKARQRKEKILGGHVAAMETSGDCGMHFPDSFNEADIELLNAERAAKRGGCSTEEIAAAKMNDDKAF